MLFRISTEGGTVIWERGTDSRSVVVCPEDFGLLQYLMDCSDGFTISVIP